jgi:hypothetical protein
MIPATVKEDILRVLSDSIPAIERKEPSILRDISNHTTHNASIFQDEYSISIAVIIYSLSKIMERSNADLHEIVFLLRRAIDALSHDQEEQYKSIMKKMLELISHIDGRLNLYIDRVISQAEIKKGSRIYEHGISMARASALLGISEWELASYVGNTQVSDEAQERFDVKKRLEYARRLFA